MANLGIFVIIATLAVGLFLLYSILKLCASKFKCFDKITALLRWLLFYRMPIRYMIESFLRLFSIFATLMIVEAAKDGKPEIRIVSTVMSIVLVAWPLWTIWFLLKNQERLHESYYKKKFFALYVGIKTTSFQSLLYYGVFIARRF